MDRVHLTPSTSSLGARALLAYGLLRAPLAWLELPLFVLLPAYYAQTYGVALGALGVTLLVARLLDAVADPWIGALLDRTQEATHGRRVILWALPGVALGYTALFFPWQGVPVLAWLGVCAVLTYLAYSVVSIAYMTWGTQLGHTPAQRVRITATREGIGLIGVLLCAALLQPAWVPWLVAGFWVLAAIASIGLTYAPLPPSRAACADQPQAQWRALLKHPPILGLLAVFLCNGIANAIPATLVLFFISDVLQAPQQAPGYLLAYFLAAAVGMPSWSALARRIGPARAWAVGMGVALAAFVSAAQLGPGDTHAFWLICLGTGWALGADLALPPALLANLLADPHAPPQRAASVVGLWNLLTKLSLALAAGLALPALQALGYTPHSGPDSTAALTTVYAWVPCALKLVALMALIRLQRT